MKKNRKKYISKMLLITAGLFTILTSCQKNEEVEEQINAEKETVYRTAGSCFDEPLGYMEGDEFFFLDENALMECWEEMLWESEEIDADFESVEYQYADHDGDGEYADIIIGYTGDGSLTAAFYIKTIGDDMMYLDGTKKTVVCNGCTQGCDPQQFGNTWICSSCFPSDDKKGCTKKTTVVITSDSK